MNFDHNTSLQKERFGFLKPLILDLNRRGKKELCHEILDLYFAQAQTVHDYDVLGFLSLKTDYRVLYLKCSERGMNMVETADQLIRARINYYKALNTMNYPDQALFYIDQHLKLDPKNVEVWLEKAAALSLLNQKQASEDLVDRLLKKYRERKEKLNYGFSGRLLRQGKLAEGVLTFLNEFKPASNLFDVQLKMEKWTGQISPGKIIYVEGEGGIGDEIINIRFFKNLAAMGMTPILYSTWVSYRKDTVDLFRRHGYQVIEEHYSIDPNELWTPLMTVPGYLNLEEKDLWTGPYLSPLNNPKNFLESDKFKIGIKCSGNPYFGQDEYRKIPIELMVDAIPENCEIYYIDKNEAPQHPRINILADKISNWEDTLDFINQMDCIVSSCTSLVHAAGAMGKTTLVAVPIAEYYIWSSSRRDNSTPWYGDNFFVYRQTQVRDWHEPLSQINQHLIKLHNDKFKTM